MKTLSDIRKEYPDYADMSDQQLADSLHKKFYSDIPKEEFYSKVGVTVEASKQPRGLASELGRQVGLTVRGGIAGTTFPATALGDALHGGAGVIHNLMGGEGNLRVPKPSDGLQNLMTKAGLPEPETELERWVQAGLSGMATTPALGLVGSLFSRYLPRMAGQAAPNVLTQNAGQQTAAAGAGGTGGQWAADTVGEETESPLAGTIAGFAAGTLFGAGGAKTVRGVQNSRAYTTEPQVTLQEIRNRAQARYQAMEAEGITLRPGSVQQAIDGAEMNLLNENFNPVMDSHRPVAQAIQQMRQIAENNPNGVPFQTLEQMRAIATGLSRESSEASRHFGRLLLDEIDGYMGNLNGRDVLPGSTGSIDNATRQVMAARQDWRNMSRARVLEELLDNAEITALKPTGSVQELLRTKFIELARNRNRMRFFTREEQNHIKAIAEGGASDKLLSIVARMNPQRSQLALTSQTGVYLMGSPTLAVGAGAAGFLSDKLLGLTRPASVRRLANEVARGQVKARPPEYGGRGAMAVKPITQEEIELLKALQ